MQRGTAEHTHADLLEKGLSLVRGHRPQRPTRDPRNERRVSPLDHPEAQVQRDERATLALLLVGRAGHAHLAERRLIRAHVHALEAPGLSAHRHLGRGRVRDLEGLTHQPATELVCKLLNVTLHLESGRPDCTASTTRPSYSLLHRLPKLGYPTADG